MSLGRLAVLLEDAIDIHDRHWKIHWMLNFAQFSATLNLRAVMQETHGKVDDALLGRLQNSASDRNWDKIRALWEMKEAGQGRPRARASSSRADDGHGDRGGARGHRTAACASSTSASEPYQQEFGWHAVWSHEFIFPTFREQAEPILQLVRDQVAEDYDYPTQDRRAAGRHRVGLRRDPAAGSRATRS